MANRKKTAEILYTVRIDAKGSRPFRLPSGQNIAVINGGILADLTRADVDALESEGWVGLLTEQELPALERVTKPAGTKPSSE